MKIARFWVKETTSAVNKRGQRVEVTRWHWSATSRDEARQRAAEAVRETARRIAAGEPWPSNDEYYPDRPPREEIIEEIHDKQDTLIATLTRNSYGALVLNAQHLMFIDVDLPERRPPSMLVRVIDRLFGRQAEDPAEQLQKKVIDLARATPDYAFRIYRTRAGFRCVVVNKRIEPTSPESLRLLDAFGADPLYVRLCKNQECFRARLTPKPWRCGAQKPPNRFPREKPEAERAYRAWLAAYKAKSQPFATCRLVEQTGTAAPDAALTALITLHDKLTKAASGLDLA